MHGSLEARYKTENGTQVLTCFTHHTSGFVLPAKKHGFEIADFKELTHPEDQPTLSRILILLFKKTS